MQPSGKKSIPDSRSPASRGRTLFRRLVKWRPWIIILIAAGFAWHTWDSQWVPEAMIPCYGQFVHDPQKEALDWQMGHPFMTGLYSGASLGFWPDGYAIPRGCSYVNEGAGIPPWTYTPFAHLAYPAFRAYAALFTFIFVWLYAALLLWAFRPAPNYKPRLKWRQDKTPRLPEPSSSLPASSTSLSPDLAAVGRATSEREDSPA